MLLTGSSRSLCCTDNHKRNGTAFRYTAGCCLGTFSVGRSLSDLAWLAHSHPQPSKLVCAQQVLSCQTPKFEREVDTMVALGGHLYIYGGTRRTPEGQDIVLKDIIMARVQDGTVKQPWKRLAISELLNPFCRLHASTAEECNEGCMTLHLGEHVYSLG